ncbi:spore coat protein U domain-containing protein [Ramlibacter sp. MMS24-I3-19]|uniref:spore coat protein U domain-containing protein n=1 Tax=Ramlibacter sp. MMS24-I3-19 TaxID=3416606 RepID=UPI003D03088A
MKSLKLARAAAVAAIAALCGTAFADTATLNVSATVTGVCKLYSSASGGVLASGSALGPMGFGGIDPTSTGNATASSAVYYRCTKGQTPTFTFSGSGTTVTTASGSSYTGTLTGSGTASGSSMTYNITWGSAPGTATGFAAATADSLPLSGTIAPAQFQAALVGPYADTVNITLAP